jgi:uncharacterized protein YggU (UPF0235/DUF167 family)
MNVQVLAHPRSKFEKVIEHEGIYNFYFNVAPEAGRANQKIIEMASGYFKIPKSNIAVIVGRTSKQKVLQIPDD